MYYCNKYALLFPYPFGNELKTNIDTDNIMD
jgi:hypothetical protein